MARPKTLRKSLPGISRFLRYFWPILRKQRALLAGSFFALFTEVLFRLLEPWPLKIIIDHVIIRKPGAGETGIALFETMTPMTLLTVSAISVVAITGLRALFAYMSTVGFALIGNRFLTQVRGILYRHLQCLSLPFHDRARGGDLIVRVVGDIGLLKEATVTAFFPLLGNTIILIGTIGVMFWLNGTLTLIACVAVPLFWITATRRSRKITDVSRKQRKREGAIATTAAESMNAIRVVQALSLDKKFADVFSKQNKQSLKEGVRAKRLAAGLERIVDVLIALATALVLWFGSRFVMKNDLTPGELLVFLAYLKYAFIPVRNFAKFTGRLAKASAAGERILDVLQESPDIKDLPGAVKAPTFRGDIEFDHVSFAYEPGYPVLDNINLRIKQGQSLSIVGPSGSGKTTMVSLMLRLYDPIRGHVRVDGRDIRDFTLASLREQISVVLQDTVLFASSVRDNISFGSPDATPEEIEKAARLANAHEFIEKMPDGYETVLGERGVTLSSGQRQRIAIARAAIRRAPILILDEPTTGLDEENESMIIRAMENLMRGKTVFIITHSMQYASRSDSVLYLEKFGRVCEYGTHQELMNKDTRYAAVFRLQAAYAKNYFAGSSNAFSQ